MQPPVTNAAAIQRRLFRLAMAARGPSGLALAATMVAACATVASAWLAAQAIVAAGGPGGAHAARSWLPALLGAIAARGLAAGLAEGAAQRISTHARSTLRLALARTLLLDRGLAADDRTGEVVTTAIDGIEKLDAFFRRFVPQAVATVVVPVVILAAVAAQDPWSALVLGTTAPLIPLFMWLLGSAAEQRARAQWRALAALGGRFLDTLQGLPTLTLFGRAAGAAAALDRDSDQLRVRTMGVLRIAFLSGMVLELAASVSIALVAASVGVRLIEGWVAFGPGLTVLLLAPEFYLPFRQFGQRHHAGMEGVAAAERIFALLDPCPASSEPQPSEPVAVARRCILSLKAVSFTYPGATASALHEVTLDLLPGTLTAIVGPSGAGKSTLVRLLLRLLEPDAGRLSLDGRDAATLSARQWRRHVALVPQRPHFVDGSVLDNLRMGRPDATLEEVVAAARLAHAHAFIAALPDSYETQLDAAASRLSGGERQRLAIARALVKAAPVLILDEPTASLDADTESAIAETIAAAARNQTVLVVAHRLDTIRRADAVVVLDCGRVVEQGAYDQLALRGPTTLRRLLQADAQEVA